VRTIARQMLERMGFRVVLAGEGSEAVQVFRDMESRGERITCVLLDLTMPHMDGEEAFRELRRLRKDVTVVLASGYSGSSIFVAAVSWRQRIEYQRFILSETSFFLVDTVTPRETTAAGNSIFAKFRSFPTSGRGSGMRPSMVFPSICKSVRQRVESSCIASSIFNSTVCQSLDS
jgi:CheY-like chemotaxis protein